MYPKPERRETVGAEGSHARRVQDAGVGGDEALSPTTIKPCHVGQVRHPGCRRKVFDEVRKIYAIGKQSPIAWRRLRDMDRRGGAEPVASHQADDGRVIRLQRIQAGAHRGIAIDRKRWVVGGCKCPFVVEGFREVVLETGEDAHAVIPAFSSEAWACSLSASRLANAGTSPSRSISVGREVPRDTT